MNLRKLIREEMDDLEWMKDIPARGELDGIRFRSITNRTRIIYTIEDIEGSGPVTIKWYDGDEESHYSRGLVKKHLDNGTWVRV